MAALRDIARDVAEEIRDGIGWVIVYRTGRSWSALTLWSDLGSGEWETDDLNDAIGILKTDPDAVVLNGYYCGHFGGGMTIDEIAAGIRWHYEGGHNRLADYYEVEQGLNAIEEARKTAEAAGLPFCERLADGPDDALDPYTYDGSMSVGDYEAVQDAKTAREELAAVVAARAPGLPAEKLDELAAAAAGLHMVVYACNINPHGGHKKKSKPGEACHLAFAFRYRNTINCCHSSGSAHIMASSHWFSTCNSFLRTGAASESSQNSGTQYGTSPDRFILPMASLIP